MKTHTLTVRDRAITWDEREVVQHGLNSDTIRVDAGSEFASCDTLALILCSASKPEPMRYMVDETLTVRIPSALMEQTGALSVCLIGYVGGAVRIVTKQERMPLVVVKSGETGGIDPDDDNPDLWGQLLAAEAARVEAENGRQAAEALRVAAETARAAAESKRQQDTSTAIGNANKATSAANSAAATAEQKGNAAQKIADNIKAAAERGDFNGADGAAGPQGPAGAPGRDGTSPTASVTQTETGATITVTDASGTTMAEVRNGRDGTGGEVADNSVTNVKLADNAVNSRTLADGAVTRAKLAQDARVKAGAGISIADDGTVGFNGNKGTFYFEDEGKVNILAKASANGTLNGTTYFSGVSTPTENSTGNVQWFIAGQVIVIAPREAVTLSVPAEWPTAAKLAFATLATGRKILKPIANARIAQLVCDEGWFYLDADVATDGTVTLSLFVTPNQAGTAIHIKQTGFTQLVLPICGGGWRLSTN